MKIYSIVHDEKGWRFVDEKKFKDLSEAKFEALYQFERLTKSEQKKTTVLVEDQNDELYFEINSKNYFVEKSKLNGEPFLTVENEYHNYIIESSYFHLDEAFHDIVSEKENFEIFAQLKEEKIKVGYLKDDEIHLNLKIIDELFVITNLTDFIDSIEFYDDIKVYNIETFDNNKSSNEIDIEI